MMQHSGIQKLAKFDSYDLVLDWNDLLRFHGRMAAGRKLEQSVGKGLRVAAVALWLLFVALVISGGNLGRVALWLPTDVLGILPWVGLAIYGYASYLLRDRGKFNFNLEHSSLLDLPKYLSKTKTVEVDNFFSLALAEKLDELIAQDPERFMLSLSGDLAGSLVGRRLLERLGVDASIFWPELQKSLLGANIKLDDHIAALATEAYTKALALEQDKIDYITLVLVLMDKLWQQTLVQLGVQTSEIAALNSWVRNEHRKQRYQELWRKMSVFKPKGMVNRAYTSRYTPTLQEYGDDYTLRATTGKFDISIGKDQAMLDILRILQKEADSHVLLIGDPGVGKSQFLRHLAVRMVVEDVPPSLKDHRLVVFDFNKAFTRNQTLENYKLTLQQMLEEVVASKDIVLVLEDLDQLLNIRSDMQSEIVNILIDSMSKYRLKLIATTSSDGYSRFIKPIRSLAAALQPIKLEEPVREISMQILIDMVPVLEAKYGVKIQIDGLRQIVDLAPRFAYERVMPDKGLDLLEEAVMEAREQGLKYVDSGLIGTIVSRKLGANVGDLAHGESEKLIKMEETMHQRVVGQDMAIKAIAAALRRSRAGLSSGKRPVASFLFFGPTGVGKTEVAKTLAEAYFGSEKMMIRVDMSEYQEEKNLERLIGFNDGNKFINGYLTEALRTKPYSLILLDEIEKANPKVLDLFLQVLDEGHVTDGAGRKIDFTNSIIIATSNAGSREIAEQIGEGMKYDSVYSTILPKLRNVFRVEFLNRFDKIIMFKPLLPVEVEQIADRMLSELHDRLMERGMSLMYDKHLLQDLVKLGYNPMYGAREIRRVIQENVEDRVAESVVRGDLISGRGIVFRSLEDYSITASGR